MPGQLKFSILEGGGACRTVYYRRDHSADTLNLLYGNPEKTRIVLGSYGAWYKVDPTTHAPYTRIAAPDNSTVSFIRLSATTNLLTIKSFDSPFIQLIDSIVAANDQLIRRTDNLIIDVRDNGGGADAAYRPVAKYLYTNPYITIGTDLYCTDDNAANFRRYAADKNFPEEDRKEIARFADSMALHKGGYWSPFQTYDEQKMDSVLPFPKKVVVLMNSHCGSTTEQFLLDPAKNSKKTVLMGAHSAGILDYANVSSLDMPCAGYYLGYATSRTKRIERGKGIDNTGILPDIFLDDQVKDWVFYAREYLEKKR